MIFSFYNKADKRSIEKVSNGNFADFLNKIDGKVETMQDAHAYDISLSFAKHQNPPTVRNSQPNHLKKKQGKMVCNSNSKTHDERGEQKQTTLDNTDHFINVNLSSTTTGLRATISKTF